MEAVSMLKRERDTTPVEVDGGDDSDDVGDDDVLRATIQAEEAMRLAAPLAGEAAPADAPRPPRREGEWSSRRIQKR